MSDVSMEAFVNAVIAGVKSEIASLRDELIEHRKVTNSRIDTLNTLIITSLTTTLITLGAAIFTSMKH